jgi:hypothetical protein
MRVIRQTGAVVALLLIAAVGGCAGPRTLDLAYSAQLKRRVGMPAPNPVVATPEAELVEVPTTVSRLVVDELNSKGISTEESFAAMELDPAAAIPGKPSVRVIYLKHRAGLIQPPLRVHDRVVVRFTPAGVFYDVKDRTSNW